MGNKKNYTLILLLAFLYKFILDYAYKTFLVGNFAYSGFVIKENYFKYAESWLLLFLLISGVVLYTKGMEKPSKVILYIILLNLLVPLLTFYSMQDGARIYLYSILFGFMLTVWIVKKLKDFRVIMIEDSVKPVFFLLAVITLYVYGYLIATGGLSRLSFNLLAVYDVRSVYQQNNSGLMNYLVTWQAYAINMSMLIYTLEGRKKQLFFLFLFLQLLLFGMTGLKSFLFAPVVVIGLYYILKNVKLKNLVLEMMTVGVLFIVSLSVLLYSVFDNINAASIFVRRLLLVPAQLHFVYFDFFSTHETMKLSHSFLSFLFENPYNSPTPVDVIASVVFNNENFNPNVGYLGDAFSNFGFMGIIVYSITLGVVLKMLDSVARHVPIYFSAPLIVIPSMALINSALPTSLVTHGILFEITAIWLFSQIFKKTKAEGVPS
ncbi:oligosaccharide repeat unit polymerase [Neobacillus sp. YIM B06451]|uniref:oligosaccharide repeat unit polymerase n=1 Tax=Neobacillus sp. YIM B06451 TaxID=3070994 RepID=UPI00292D8DC2|nr:oligosaccharide repeat unit polymerase [Neobacillus sp. YIM B06451]